MQTLELTLTAPNSGGGDMAPEKSHGSAAPDGEFGRMMERAMAPGEKNGATTNAPSNKGKTPAAPGRTAVIKAPAGSKAGAPEPEALPETNPPVEKSSGETPAVPPEKIVMTDQKTPADFILDLTLRMPDLSQPPPIFLSLPQPAPFTAGAEEEKAPAEVSGPVQGISSVPATTAVAGAGALPSVKTAPAVSPGNRGVTPEKMASANLPGATASAAVKTATFIFPGEPALTTEQLAPPVLPDARTLADKKNAPAILPDEPAVTTAKTAALVLPQGMALAAGKYASAILPGEPAMAAGKIASLISAGEPALSAAKLAPPVLPGEMALASEKNSALTVSGEPALAAGKTASPILPDEPVVTTAKTAAPVLPAGMALAAGKYASAILPGEPALAAVKTASLISAGEPALSAAKLAPPVLPGEMALASEKTSSLTVPGEPALAAGRTAPAMLPDEPVMTNGKLADPALAGAISLVTGKIPASVLPVEPAALENPVARFLGDVPVPAASVPEKIISRSERQDAVTVDGKIIPPPLPELKLVPEKLVSSWSPVEQGTTAIAPTMKDFVPPTDARTDAAAMAEKFEIVSNGSLSRAAEGAGTGVATVESPMKKTGNANKVAGLDVKVLPGGTFDAVRERVLPSLTSVAPERRSENRSLDFIPSFPVANAPLADTADAQNLISLPSLTEVRMKNVERTHDLVALHALRLVESKSDSMSVVIKPGAGTELSLELRHRNGGVEAEAILQRGDYQLLNAHWPELQQKLELRGIKLGPLGGEGNFSSTDNGSFSQRQSSREEEAQQASAFAEFTMAVNPKGATARHASSGWESWA